MADALHIRPAAAADVGALLALYRDLSPDDPVLDPDAAAVRLKQFAAYPGSAVLLGLAGGTAVATCALIIVPNLTRGGRPYALIENVVTAAGHRKRGFGRAILNHAVGRAWEADCYKVMLMTGSKRPETLRFYEQSGFEPSKTGFQIRRLPAR